MERENAFLEISFIRFFAEFAYCYFYRILIITLQYNFTINLNEFGFQIWMRIDNQFQCIYHLVRIYSFESIDKRNVILCGIRILLPFQIKASLVLHQRVIIASLIDRRRAIRSMRKEGCYCSHRGAFHDLCHLNVYFEMTLEKCAQAHGS